MNEALDKLRKMPTSTLKYQRRMMSVEAMARQYNVSLSSVYKELSARGIKGRRGPTRLTEKEVRAMRNMQNPDIKKLAKKYHVHTLTIKNVLEYKSWRFVK